MRRPLLGAVSLLAAIALVAAAPGSADASRRVSRPSGDRTAMQPVKKNPGLQHPEDRGHATSGVATSGVRPAGPPASFGPAVAGNGNHDHRAPEPLRIPDAALEPVGWSDLNGWSGDDHASAFAAFQASCRPIVRSKTSDERPVRAALEGVCARAIKTGTLGGAAAREFFENNFLPIRIRKLGDAAGFLTGYYEPIVDGSRFPTREFTVPLYRRPPDLIAAGATQPGGPFPNGGRAFRRGADGELAPYYDRGEIEDGALDGQHLEICWLRSATDALFIQIQGSARIRLEDGTMLRINYDAHNGYPYVPVGRVLIERNIIPREEMSMHRIREWMQAHPDEAKDVRRQNRSVVFFRIVGLTEDGEALGAQGIPLSAGRSIAVDKALHVYGTPFFIAADLPIASVQAATPFRRTMIAQDTGSAIVGPARADLYFGAGDEAGLVAGRVRQPGQFAMLLPRDLDLVAAGAHMPLPRERPAASPDVGGRSRHRLESKSASVATRLEHGHPLHRVVR
jgi:membrane-bound lytic murein transglycosylase A